MWDTLDLNLFLTQHCYECSGFAWREHSHNLPPSGEYRGIGDYNFGQLLEGVDFNWYAVSVTDYPEGNYPHFKVVLESEVDRDDRLLRGEIMTIADIMTARLKPQLPLEHTIAPVRPPWWIHNAPLTSQSTLVFSFMGPRHARVLGADLDGEILHTRASKLYDFTQKNTDVVQLLTRYWLGGACGRTVMKT
ncbi:uncharacterized protein N7500_000273 [Penicillium coprophilum]|uniref:uncharacterized protein n=1 Tax=Penicillium coprophilum TaxID=36646 RepID=UPI0023836F7E|nr:uncharacterized protein N7500_000273 [Penicillium coprophilum]KAJ5177574.1 hypothetical protein N7500_000273 [Penicillium coprophilum]